MVTNDWWAYFISPLCASNLWPRPPPPAKGNSKDLNFVSAVPHSNHHTVWTASWQNHGSSPPQSVIILHCHDQRPTFPPHYGDNVKVKSQHICLANPALLRSFGEAVVTNDWCIIYSLLCTSHENLVLSHPTPKINILIQNTKYDIHWYIFQPISKYIPTPSQCSLSLSVSTVKGWTSSVFIWWVFFTWITPTRWALWSFSLINYSC